MKKGETADCGHVETIGRPSALCPDCHRKMVECIEIWNAKTRVKEKIKSGQCPF